MRGAPSKPHGATAPRPRGLGGYADLLLAYAEGGWDALDAVATLLGYEATPRKETAVSGAAPRSPRVERPLESAERQEIKVRPLADAPFWQLERHEFFGARPPPPPAERQTFHDTVPDALPPVAGLCTWNALVPRLRTNVTEARAGQRIADALDVVLDRDELGLRSLTIVRMP